MSRNNDNETFRCVSYNARNIFVKDAYEQLPRAYVFVGAYDFIGVKTRIPFNKYFVVSSAIVSKNWRRVGRLDAERITRREYESIESVCRYAIVGYRENIAEDKVEYVRWRNEEEGLAWKNNMVGVFCVWKRDHDRSAHPKNYPQFRSRRDGYIEKDRAHYGEQRWGRKKLEGGRRERILGGRLQV